MKPSKILMESCWKAKNIFQFCQIHQSVLIPQMHAEAHCDCSPWCMSSEKHEGHADWNGPADMLKTCIHEITKNLKLKQTKVKPSRLRPSNDPSSHLKVHKATTQGKVQSNMCQKLCYHAWWQPIASWAWRLPGSQRVMHGRWSWAQNASHNHAKQEPLHIQLRVTCRPLLADIWLDDPDHVLNKLVLSHRKSSDLVELATNKRERERDVVSWN